MLQWVVVFFEEKAVSLHMGSDLSIRVARLGGQNGNFYCNIEQKKTSKNAEDINPWREWAEENRSGSSPVSQKPLRLQWTLDRWRLEKQNLDWWIWSVQMVWVWIWCWIKSRNPWTLCQPSGVGGEMTCFSRYILPLNTNQLWFECCGLLEYCCIHLWPTIYNLLIAPSSDMT